MVETHYTNFNKERGQYDSSGVEFYITDNLRKYDAGTTLLGPILGEVNFRTFPVFKPLRVPPRQKAWELRSDCMVNDILRSREGLLEKSVVFATRAHGHLNMRSAYMELYKIESGKLNKTMDFGIVEKFDYDFQPAVYVDGNGINIERGDMIR